MQKRIYLAGGCFWGIEAYFSRLGGVIDTTAGYANGDAKRFADPTYKQVCNENTNYAETVEIIYDSNKIDLETLLSHFFMIINPTTLNRQANDIGSQYRSGIYYVDKSDAPIIKKVVKQQQKLYPSPIVTETEELKNFFPAEDYHQDYLKHNPQGYCHIKLPD